MIYLDSSIVLAQVRSEDRHPPPEFWNNSFVSSRLLQYETWTRLHAAGRDQAEAEMARGLLIRVSYVELVPEVLDPLVEGLRVPVKTLDAIHLITMRWLEGQRLRVELATYDEKLAAAARKLGFALHPESG